MKAFVKPGPSTDTLQFDEVSIPDIGADELLVRVHAVGVGIHDSYFLPNEMTYPYPIGIEAAGVIEQTGDDVTGHAIGDRITFVSSMQPKGGTWAEYVAVKATSLIIPIPSTMSFVDAAAVPVAGNTALRAIGALSSIPAAGSLFIAGGSGAIGTFSIQIAREHGWQVAASASKRNHDYMGALGAHKVVDYHDSTWTEQIRQWMPAGVDGAIAVQPGTAVQSLPVVKDGGRLIAISGDSVASERGITVGLVPHTSDVRAELSQLMKSIAAEETRVEIERVYPFDEALDALAKVQTRHVRGKLVLQLD